MSNILDLSGADTSGFEAIDAGSYNATVFEVELVETSGQGKLPQGVPMAKVQFAIQDDGPAKNRRIFNNYPLPNNEQSENASIMQGNFVKFLTALGEDEKKIKTKGFDLSSLEDLVGKPCVIKVAKEVYKRDPADEETWQMTNPVKSVKPAGSPVGTVGPSANSDLL
jgi:hypothetical protein